MRLLYVCSCIFKVFTLFWANQRHFFENATARIKRTYKTSVSMQLYRSQFQRCKWYCYNILIILIMFKLSFQICLFQTIIFWLMIIILLQREEKQAIFNLRIQFTYLEWLKVTFDFSAIINLRRKFFLCEEMFLFWSDEFIKGHRVIELFHYYLKIVWNLFSYFHLIVFIC